LEIRSRLIGNSRARRLWFGLAAICALLAGSVVLAPPAYAGTVALEHVCEVIGDDNPLNGSGYHEAVVCTDLLQVDDGYGGFLAEARTEVFCQTNIGIVEACNSVWAWNEAARATSGGTVVSQLGGNFCGVQGYGACPVGRLYDTSPYVADALCIRNAWGVTLGSTIPGHGTTVWLPGSNKAVKLLANYASPHADVGNFC
jgi:hypothetical protein